MIATGQDLIVEDGKGLEPGRTSEGRARAELSAPGIPDAPKHPMRCDSVVECFAAKES